MAWTECGVNDVSEARLTNREGVVKAWKFEAEVELQDGTCEPVAFHGVLVRQPHGDVCCVPNPLNDDECMKMGTKPGEWDAVAGTVLNSALWSYCEAKFGDAIKEVR